MRFCVAGHHAAYSGAGITLTFLTFLSFPQSPDSFLFHIHRHRFRYSGPILHFLLAFSSSVPYLVLSFFSFVLPFCFLLCFYCNLFGLISVPHALLKLFKVSELHIGHTCWIEHVDDVGHVQRSLSNQSIRACMCKLKNEGWEIDKSRNIKEI